MKKYFINIYFILPLIFFITPIITMIENKWGYNPIYYNLAESIGQDTGIVVITYNRPHYFKRIVKSLEKNPESSYVPFIFILDGGPNATQTENIEIINQSKIKNKYIVTHTTNYGCGRSAIDARRFMFEWCKFQRIILFEDDLVVNPEYIALTLALHNWAKKNYHNVGIVQCFNRCFLSPQEKEKNLDKVLEIYGNCWGYCLDSVVYYAIRDLLNEYEQKYLIGTPNHKANCSEIANWIEHCLANLYRRHTKKFPNSVDYKIAFHRHIKRLKKSKLKHRDGQDYEMRIALFKAGYVRIATLVNRAQYIGRQGCHHGQSHWNKLLFFKMTGDQFTSDCTRNFFSAIDGNNENISPLIIDFDNVQHDIHHYCTYLIEMLIENNIPFIIKNLRFQLDCCYDLSRFIAKDSHIISTNNFILLPIIFKQNDIDKKNILRSIQQYKEFPKIFLTIDAESNKNFAQLINKKIRSSMNYIIVTKSRFKKRLIRNNYPEMQIGFWQDLMQILFKNYQNNTKLRNFKSHIIT